jgi:hypothetical protein
LNEFAPPRQLKRSVALMAQLTLAPTEVHMGFLDLITGRKKEVTLPISIAKVVYMVAGERGYEGDLILTQNVIYFFPHTDLIRRRINNAANFSAVLLAGGGVGPALAAAVSNNLTKSRRSNPNLPTGEEITASLEQKLDAYIETKKSERKDALMDGSLPLPMRFTKTSIETMRGTFRGFTFDASFDNHDFIVGNRALLNGALKAGGYLP